MQSPLVLTSKDAYGNEQQFETPTLRRINQKEQEKLLMPKNYIRYACTNTHPAPATELIKQLTYIIKQLETNWLSSGRAFSFHLTIDEKTTQPQEVNVK